MSQMDELIHRYEQGVAVIEDALRNVPDAVLDRAPAPGKWTIRQLAAHLADSEIVVATRLRWIAAEPGCPLKAYDQDRWASTLGYAKQAPQQALELFRALRSSTATMLRALPDSAWTNVGHHEERGEVSLRQMLELASDHAEHHAKQIRDVRNRFAAAA